MKVVESAWGAAATRPAATAHTPAEKRPRRLLKQESSSGTEDDGVLSPPSKPADGATMTSSRGRPIQAVSMLLNKP